MKKRKAKASGRARARPFQLYLSDDEREALTQTAEADGCSASDIVRNWINVYSKRASKRRVADARQITLTQHLEATS